VLITTPVFLHPEHFEAAVEPRKHIYCEKPSGTDVAGVKRLVRAAHKADASEVIQFGFQQRFSPSILARSISCAPAGRVAAHAQRLAARRRAGV
jgi:myo-inositol 2-dehydrogenase/D-chiro-inositol 1-dehydrogenase